MCTYWLAIQSISFYVFTLTRGFSDINTSRASRAWLLSHHQLHFTIIYQLSISLLTYSNRRNDYTLVDRRRPIWRQLRRIRSVWRTRLEEQRHRPREDCELADCCSLSCRSRLVSIYLHFNQVLNLSCLSRLTIHASSDFCNSSSTPSLSWSRNKPRLKMSGLKDSSRQALLGFLDRFMRWF